MKEKYKFSVIITASFINSHPDIRYIKKVIDSLELGNININNVNIILAHDGLKDYQLENNNIVERYSDYINSLNKYYKDYPNIKVVVRTNHGHLTGNVRNALQYIKTKYILIIQHDLAFSRKFNIKKIIKDMEKNKELKHVRFNKRRNIKYKWDDDNLFGNVLKCNYYNYTSTGAWSDLNHLTTLDYYKNIIMKECNDGISMEWKYRDKINNVNLINDKETHKKYGTYIFGDINNKSMIDNLDGRRNKY